MRFGRFELLPERRLLLRDGEAISVGGRALELLMALARHHHRVVGTDELLQWVWPGRVVQAHNVATQVRALRRLLGPATILTVSGRGYRFAPLLADSPVPEAASFCDAQPLVPLLGRDEELEALGHALRSQGLLALLGAGGVGKTLLARHLAARDAPRAAGGSVWVDLAAVDAAPALAVAIAQAAGIGLRGGEPCSALVASLAGRAMLLILDGAETCVEPVRRLVAAIRLSAPAVRVVLTSRAPLGLSAGHVHHLRPLPTPPRTLPAAQALAYPSVSLFVERARQAVPGFEFDDAQAGPVIDICERLDGVPLALELAAERLPVLGTTRLAASLNRRFDVLTRNRDALAPMRQQSLRACLQWSFDGLDACARRVWLGLGAMRGMAPVDAIQAALLEPRHGLDEWTVLEGLCTLVDRSLVLASGDPLPRYGLMQSTRAFACERLELQGELAWIRRLQAQRLARLRSGIARDAASKDAEA